jgi:two-component system phosphate regulon sensor histidine kinase PhoR
MWKPRSIGWPITLAVIMSVLLVAVTVGWIIVFARMALEAPVGSGLYWALLVVGSVFLGLVLVGVVLYLLLSIKEINLNRRQSNFIDSVTHELKSPIASLKLYLQTMARRTLTEPQRAEFHRFMMEDVERLDSLINHLLEAAKLDEAPVNGEISDVELAAVLTRCAHEARDRHGVSADAVRLDLSPAVVAARPMDVEMVFRNLIDNAVKYSGPEPKVDIQLSPKGDDTIQVRVMDNGPGIPMHLRRKIFGRFVRLGSELERAKSGTGLGLFIVRTLVKRMRGKIHVRGRGSRQGTIFEVTLPGRRLDPREAAA